MPLAVCFNFSVSYLSVKRIASKKLLLNKFIQFAHELGNIVDAQKRGCSWSCRDLLEEFQISLLLHIRAKNAKFG